MNVTIHVAGDAIEEATCETYPCPGCVACGRAICEMVKGMRIDQAEEINHPALVERVGPLPRHRRICYGLALLALADALEQIRAPKEASEWPR